MGVGGTSTMDFGIGCLQALGLNFKYNNMCYNDIKDCINIFGPQKGLSENDIILYNDYFKNINNLFFDINSSS